MRSGDLGAVAGAARSHLAQPLAHLSHLFGAQRSERLARRRMALLAVPDEVLARRVQRERGNGYRRVGVLAAVAARNEGQHKTKKGNTKRSAQKRNTTHRHIRHVSFFPTVA